MRKFCIFALLSASIAGCIADSPPSIELPAEAEPLELNFADDTLHDQIGNRVTLTGKTIDHKMGASLNCETFWVEVDLPSRHWPMGMYHGDSDGELVRVTGTVARRSGRYILEFVEWELAGNGDITK